MTDHPFVPGARVAVRNLYSDRVIENFVDKVYKTGNFTLRGSSQQWKPWQNSYGQRTWAASETGSGRWSGSRLDLWDETTDAKISADIEASKARHRWNDLRRKVERIREPDNVLCDAIEVALLAFEEDKQRLSRTDERGQESKCE